MMKMNKLKWLTDIKNPHENVSPLEVDFKTVCISKGWQECMDTVKKAYEDRRCEYCGAGDDAHHSYTCPTGLHADRESRAVELLRELGDKIYEWRSDCDCYSVAGVEKQVLKIEELLEDRDG